MSKKSNKQAKQRAARTAQRDAATNPSSLDGIAQPMSPPYGYTQGDDETLTPNEAEVEVITQIRELSEKRLSVKGIVAKLTAEELDCRGAAWDEKHVKQILRRNYEKPPSGR
ncbi:MAG: hypothetical protein ACI9MR_004051 [Myxococcota bacterium]|jgi:hypothetical protein